MFGRFIGAVKTVLEELDPSLPPSPHAAIRVRLHACHQETTELWKRYKETNDVKLLQSIVALNREKLSLTGHIDRAGLSVPRRNLGHSLKELAECTNDNQVLMEAVELLRLSTKDHPPGHPDQADPHARLASALVLLYKRTKDVDVLEEIVDIQRRILKTWHHSGHEARAHSCTNLSLSLLKLYRIRGDMTLLDEAVACQREALALPLDSSDEIQNTFTMHHNMTNLLMALKDAGVNVLLPDLIDARRKAINACPPSLYATSVALGSDMIVDLMQLYEQTSDIRHLEGGEWSNPLVGRRTMPKDPLIWSKYFERLSVAHYERFIQRATISDLHTANQMGLKAMSLCAPDSDWLEAVLSHHFRCLIAWYEHSCDNGTLNTQIEISRDQLVQTPPGHKIRVLRYVELALVLMVSYDHDGDIDDLAESIALFHEAQSLREVFPSMDQCLGMCFETLSQWTHGDPQLVIPEEALIQKQRDTYQSLSSDDPKRPASAAAFVDQLSAQYYRTGKVDNLFEALRVGMEVLDDLSVMHASHDNICASVTSCLLTIYNSVSGELALLQEAVTLSRKRIIELSKANKKSMKASSMLMQLLAVYYKATGDEALLSEVQDMAQATLSQKVDPKGYQSIICYVVGNSFISLFQRTGDMTLLDTAIDLSREAKTKSTDSTELILADGTLTRVLMQKYKVTGEPVLIREVLELDRKAVDQSRFGLPERADEYTTLADSLMSYAALTGESDSLHEAIQLHRQTMVAFSKGHPYRADACIDLVESLNMLYQLTGDEGTWTELERVAEEALSLNPAIRQRRALTCTNVALSFISRYDRTQDAGLVEQAVLLQREALRLRHPTDPDGPWVYAHLATSLALLSEHLGDEAHLTEAIELDREALKLWTVIHPDRLKTRMHLARCLRLLHERTQNLGTLDEAISLEIDYVQ